jgi:hypothetical protein
VVNLNNYFSAIPKWLCGGFGVVFLFWLIVFPIELLQFVVRYEFLPVSAFTGIVRSFWIVGFLIATTVISTSAISIVLRLVVVLLGLIIASPAYFLIGVLLGARANIWKIFGFSLFVIKLILGYFLMRTVFYL